MNILGYTLTMTGFWILAMVIFLIVEAATVGLASIWFAVGALAAMFISMLGGGTWLQIVVFFLVSALMLYFTRPLAKKYVNGKVQATNADIIIGKECRVTEAISNLEATGAVYVDGKTWTARSSDDGLVIPEGSVVIAEKIDGVKLIVKPCAEHASI